MLKKIKIEFTCSVSWTICQSDWEGTNAIAGYESYESKSIWTCNISDASDRKSFSPLASSGESKVAIENGTYQRVLDIECNSTLDETAWTHVIRIWANELPVRFSHIKEPYILTPVESWVTELRHMLCALWKMDYCEQKKVSDYEDIAAIKMHLGITDVQVAVKEAIDAYNKSNFTQMFQKIIMAYEADWQFLIEYIASEINQINLGEKPLGINYRYLIKFIDMLLIMTNSPLNKDPDVLSLLQTTVLPELEGHDAATSSNKLFDTNIEKHNYFVKLSEGAPWQKTATDLNKQSGPGFFDKSDRESSAETTLVHTTTSHVPL